MAIFLSILQKNKASILMVMVIALVASTIATFAQPFEYQSAFSLLVIEKEASLDGYAASKSAERLSTSLSQIMYTASFADRVYERVKNAGLATDTVIFTDDEQERRDAWKRHVETRILPDIGILKVAVYHPDRSQAHVIAHGLAQVLTEQGAEYLGGGSDVVLKIVDFPLTSKRPVRPNIPFNLVAGTLLGFAAAWTFQYVRNQAQRASMVLAPMQPAPRYDEGYGTHEAPQQIQEYPIQAPETEAPLRVGYDAAYATSATQEPRYGVETQTMDEDAGWRMP